MLIVADSAERRIHSAHQTCSFILPKSPDNWISNNVDENGGVQDQMGTMTFDTEQSSPCLNCPIREFAFCGRLLGAERDTPLRQAHRSTPARQSIYVAGEPNEDIVILCEGWAARVMRLPDGQRQILSFLLPGDVVSTTALFRDSLSYDVKSITHARYVRIRREDVFARVVGDVAVLNAFAEICCEEKEEADEVLADVGQRIADQRIARLMIRLIRRLAARGLGAERSFAFPLRQQHIADAVGLTPVHVSRIISSFRKDEVIDFSRGVLRILDPFRFLEIAGVRHKGGRGQQDPFLAT
jgi:CRP-like cAMP-binding protein